MVSRGADGLPGVFGNPLGLQASLGIPLGFLGFQGAFRGALKGVSEGHPQWHLQEFMVTVILF